MSETAQERRRGINGREEEEEEKERGGIGWRGEKNGYDIVIVDKKVGTTL